MGEQFSTCNNEKDEQYVTALKMYQFVQRVEANFMAYYIH